MNNMGRKLTCKTQSLGAHMRTALQDHVVQELEWGSSPALFYPTQKLVRDPVNSTRPTSTGIAQVDSDGSLL